MSRRLQIPTEQEIQVIIKWGATRILIAIPQAILFSLKQISRLSLHCTSTLENLYQIAIVQPFDALIWTEATMKTIEAESIMLDTKPELFDWSLFKKEPNHFPHIRIIAKTGMGKTTLAEWLLFILGGESFVITPKAKPTDWIGYPVFGKGFDYESCIDRLNDISQEISRRFSSLDHGHDFGFINFACDEWRLIADNKPEAKDLMREILTIARDVKIRMIAIAQGEQVKTWGLEGESDLEECFTTIRLGQFAIDYAKKIRLSPSVLQWLQSQQRPCMVDSKPAEIPDLSHFKNRLAIAPTQIQATSNSDPKPGLEIYSEPLQNIDYDTQNQNSEALVWAAIDAVLLSDPDRSTDWLCKKIIMPRMNCGRPKAEQIYQELREKFTDS
jgi:hypothetical protein